MNSIKITKRQQTLIEQLAIFNEKQGIPPASSRVLALLLVADRTELSFDEIRETLEITKSAASGAINLLLKANKIEFLTREGERKRYFRCKILNWKEDMKNSLTGMTVMISLFQEILKQRPKSTKEFNSTLAEIIDFWEFFQQQIPGIFKKWESKNK